MHPHQQLLTKLFQCLNAHDHQGMAECYHPQATFEDIAFRLQGRQQIHAMWDMICSKSSDGIDSDIVATVKEVSANDATGRAVVVDDYTYRDTGKKVHNEIVSTFEFRDGKIFRQQDTCDPKAWARQAMGGLKGFIAGRFPRLRRRKAMNKLKAARPAAFRG